jgi:hypothetical protein
VSGCGDAWTVATIDRSLSRRAVTACRNASDASSIFPNSSITTTLAPSASDGNATSSNDVMSTPYFPTRGGPNRSICSRVARAPERPFDLEADPMPTLTDLFGGERHHSDA